MNGEKKLRVESHPTKSAYKSNLSGKGLSWKRYFTRSGVHPFDELEWEIRTARITNSKGEVIFEQEGVEVPKTWSQTSTNIIASKYFHGALDGSDREYSLKQLITRVVKTIVGWGIKQSYFATAEDAKIFSDELTHILVNQKAAFNSPVWFNVGIEEKPQCSACFINSVEDTMESILNLAKIEGLLFKYGSGTGTNFSSLRSSFERVSGGGVASGPVSFMKGYDAFAGVIKSGGKTRRAAKMVILNIDHPDIVEFIQCKAKEEKKAWALIEAGFDGSFDGEAYASIFFQNANNSVRVTNDFMKAVENDGEWHTRSVTTKEVVHTYKARDMMKLISECAHICGDPGIQFDTTINKWNTCKSSGKINASNPCSEYMFLDNSACNLASLNLLKFVDKSGNFDTESFKHAVDTVFTAQEILVDNAGYPTPAIDKNSKEYRPLGLGYANLGALLMYMGLPYDSCQGRDFAATLTAIMTGESYLMSTKIAAIKKPFKHYKKNRISFIEVMGYHKDALNNIDPENVPSYMIEESKKLWDRVIEEGKKHGFRNAQATVLAPTGTIGFMMDCDTTGIEPDLALVKYKQLVGGGTIKITNRTVPAALKRLGYTAEQSGEIIRYIEDTGTIEGAPYIQKNHLPVFDCAFKPINGTRYIHYMGHVKMMAAVQSFLSGAISKTVNMPQEATPEDIEDVYMQAWRMGIKAIAIYREGSKKIQPLSTGKPDKSKLTEETRIVYRPVRKKLPKERKAITHKFRVGNHEGYITVGMYDDGQPGEIFVVIAKEGSTISGLMDGFATAISMTLQYGVPLKVLINKFTHTRFEPSGYTGNPNIPYAKSILDYIFKWLALKFLSPEEQKKVGIITPDVIVESSIIQAESQSELNQKKSEDKEEKIKTFFFESTSDAPLCDNCGFLMVRNGSCYKCPNCGNTSGCS